MNLPKLAVNRPVTTFMILVSIIVIGGIAMARLPLAFLPVAQLLQPQVFLALLFEAMKIFWNTSAPLPAVATIRWALARWGRTKWQSSMIS